MKTTLFINLMVLITCFQAFSNQNLDNKITKSGSVTYTRFKVTTSSQDQRYKIISLTKQEVISRCGDVRRRVDMSETVGPSEESYTVNIVPEEQPEGSCRAEGSSTYEILKLELPEFPLKEQCFYKFEKINDKTFDLHKSKVAYCLYEATILVPAGYDLVAQ